MRKIISFDNNITNEDLIQLIGESEELQPKLSFSDSQNTLFIKRSRLCQLLNDIEYTIENYGLANFFIEYDDQITELVELGDLLKEFNHLNTISAIKKVLDFYKKNKLIFSYLRTNPSDFDLKYEIIEQQISKINETDIFHIPLSNSIELLGEYIRKNKSEFFFSK